MLTIWEVLQDILEALYLLKKPHLYPFGSFKDLSIHRDRQQEATLFYIMLCSQFRNTNIIASLHCFSDQRRKAGTNNLTFVTV
jgi:hypothetical protein